MTKVKICGIKTEECALAAAKAGADFIGLVFTNSPRQITPSQANKIVAALKDMKTARPEIVGLFVNTPVHVVNRIAEFCRLDWVQLSGIENFTYCQEITYPIIKVMRISRSHQPEQVCRDLGVWSQILSNQKHRFLLDSYDRDKYGGTGKTLDWNTARPIAEKFDVFIAGGLTPENVATAIRTARPWGVDVSSGVETEGEKDVKKIRAFVKAVRDTDAG
jgi:phosphoribosylanthranilate isomerase